MTSRSHVIGVDPGQTGALICLGDNGDLVDYLDMPIVHLPRSKMKYIDGYAVASFFLRWCPKLIVIEQVSSRPGQGIASSFQFGASYGAIVALALSQSCPVELVSPAKWKRSCGLIGTAKEAALVRCRRRWSKHDHVFKRKKDIGRADAALIADFGRTSLVYT